MYQQQTCAICLEDLDKDYYLDSCKHLFHKKCITNFISYNLQKLKCPLCRTNINSIDLDNLYPTWQQEITEIQEQYVDGLTYIINEQRIMEELEIDRNIEEYLAQERYEQSMVEEY